MVRRACLATLIGLLMLAASIFVVDSLLGARAILTEWQFGSQRQLAIWLVTDAVLYLICFGLPCTGLALGLLCARRRVGRCLGLSSATVISIGLAGALLGTGIPMMSALCLLVSLLLALTVAAW